MDYSGEAFLNKLYQNLHLSDEVMYTATASDTKDEKVKKYMDRLERVHEMANNPHKLEILKNYYYRKYVIKEEDIPTYMNKDAIIKAQKESLDKWLDYLTDENAVYPVWAKYWAFQGMLKIGTYDEANDTYGKRSKKTLAPFIEANPEVIAKCIDLVLKYTGKEKIEDEELERLIENGNFQKLYTIFISRKKEALQNSSTEGIWIKYNNETAEEALSKEENGEEPEYLKLYNSLQGYNTGWCTAGSRDMAKNQICGGGGYPGGDFYVYYTKNQEGLEVVPRLAIRMDGHDRIAEIRGIADSQNVEEGFEDIIADKLKSMKNLSEEDVSYYLQIIQDMKSLTKINQKVNRKEDLTLSEQAFILEIEHEISGFGWEDDPRIAEIRKNYVIIDKDIVIEAVKQNGYLLEFASPELQNDREIVMTAVKQNGYALNFASPELQNDKDVVLEAVKQNGLVLNFASPELQNDKDIVMEAVKQNGLALKYASSELQNNREIVMEAVRNSAYALEFASSKLRNDNDVIITATLNYVKSEQNKIQSKVQYFDISGYMYREWMRWIRHLIKFGVYTNKEVEDHITRIFDEAISMQYGDEDNQYGENFGRKL